MARIREPLGPLCWHTVKFTPDTLLPPLAWKALKADAEARGIEPPALRELFIRLCSPHDASLATVRLDVLAQEYEPAHRRVLNRMTSARASGHDRLLYEDAAAFLMETCALDFYGVVEAAASSLVGDYSAAGLNTIQVRAICKYLNSGDSLDGALLRPLGVRILGHMFTEPGGGDFHDTRALVHFAARYPTIIAPVIALQRSLQRRFFGQTVWREFHRRAGSALFPPDFTGGHAALVSARVIMLEAVSLAAVPFLFGTADSAVVHSVQSTDAHASVAAAARPGSDPLSPMFIDMEGVGAAGLARRMRAWRTAAATTSMNAIVELQSRVAHAVGRALGQASRLLTGGGSGARARREETARAAAESAAISRRAQRLRRLSQSLGVQDMSHAAREDLAALRTITNAHISSATRRRGSIVSVPLAVAEHETGTRTLATHNQSRTTAPCTDPGQPNVVVHDGATATTTATTAVAHGTRNAYAEGLSIIVQHIDAAAADDFEPDREKGGIVSGIHAAMGTTTTINDNSSRRASTDQQQQQQQRRRVSSKKKRRSSLLAQISLADAALQEPAEDAAALRQEAWEAHFDLNEEYKAAAMDECVLALTHAAEEEDANEWGQAVEDRNRRAEQAKLKEEERLRRLGTHPVVLQAAAAARRVTGGFGASLASEAQVKARADARDASAYGKQAAANELVASSEAGLEEYVRGGGGGRRRSSGSGGGASRPSRGGGVDDIVAIDDTHDPRQIREKHWVAVEDTHIPAPHKPSNHQGTGVTGRPTLALAQHAHEGVSSLAQTLPEAHNAGTAKQGSSASPVRSTLLQSSALSGSTSTATPAAATITGDVVVGPIISLIPEAELKTRPNDASTGITSIAQQQQQLDQHQHRHVVQHQPQQLQHSQSQLVERRLSVGTPGGDDGTLALTYAQNNEAPPGTVVYMLMNPVDKSLPTPTTDGAKQAAYLATHPTPGGGPAFALSSLHIAQRVIAHLSSGAGTAYGIVECPCLLCGRIVEPLVLPRASAITVDPITPLPVSLDDFTTVDAGTLDMTDPHPLLPETRPLTIAGTLASGVNNDRGGDVGRVAPDGRINSSDRGGHRDFEGVAVGLALTSRSDPGLPSSSSSVSPSASSSSSVVVSQSSSSEFSSALPGAPVPATAVSEQLASKTVILASSVSAGVSAMAGARATASASTSVLLVESPEKSSSVVVSFKHANYGQLQLPEGGLAQYTSPTPLNIRIPAGATAVASTAGATATPLNIRISATGATAPSAVAAFASALVGPHPAFDSDTASNLASANSHPQLPLHRSVAPMLSSKRRMDSISERRALCSTFISPRDSRSALVKAKIAAADATMVIAAPWLIDASQGSGSLSRGESRSSPRGGSGSTPRGTTPTPPPSSSAATRGGSGYTPTPPPSSAATRGGDIATVDSSGSARSLSITGAIAGGIAAVAPSGKGSARGLALLPGIATIVRASRRGRAADAPSGISPGVSSASAVAPGDASPRDAPVSAAAPASVAAAPMGIIESSPPTEDHPAVSLNAASASSSLPPTVDNAARVCADGARLGLDTAAAATGTPSNSVARSGTYSSADHLTLHSGTADTSTGQHSLPHAAAHVPSPARRILPLDEDTVLIEGTDGYLRRSRRAAAPPATATTTATTATTTTSAAAATTNDAAVTTMAESSTTPVAIDRTATVHTAATVTNATSGLNVPISLSNNTATTTTRPIGLTAEVAMSEADYTSSAAAALGPPLMPETMERRRVARARLESARSRAADQSDRLAEAQCLVTHLLANEVDAADHAARVKARLLAFSGFATQAAASSLSVPSSASSFSSSSDAAAAAAAVAAAVVGGSSSALDSTASDGAPNTAVPAAEQHAIFAFIDADELAEATRAAVVSARNHGSAIVHSRASAAVHADAQKTAGVMLEDALEDVAVAAISRARRKLAQQQWEQQQEWLQQQEAASIRASTTPLHERTDDTAITTTHHHHSAVGRELGAAPSAVAMHSHHRASPPTSGTNSTPRNDESRTSASSTVAGQQRSEVSSASQNGILTSSSSPAAQMPTATLQQQQAQPTAKTTNTGFCSECDEYCRRAIAAVYGNSLASLVLEEAAVKPDAHHALKAHPTPTAPPAPRRKREPSKPRKMRRGSVSHTTAAAGSLDFGDDDVLRPAKPTGATSSSTPASTSSGGGGGGRDFRQHTGAGGGRVRGPHSASHTAGAAEALLSPPPPPVDMIATRYRRGLKEGAFGTRFQQMLDAESGRFFYYDVATGHSQWVAPKSFTPFHDKHASLHM